MDWFCAVFKSVKSEVKRCLGLQQDVDEQQVVCTKKDDRANETKREVQRSETRIQVCINVSVSKLYCKTNCPGKVC